MEHLPCDSYKECALGLLRGIMSELQQMDEAEDGEEGYCNEEAVQIMHAARNEMDCWLDLHDIDLLLVKDDGKLS